MCCFITKSEGFKFFSLHHLCIDWCFSWYYFHPLFLQILFLFHFLCYDFLAISSKPSTYTTPYSFFHISKNFYFHTFVFFCTEWFISVHSFFLQLYLICYLTYLIAFFFLVFWMLSFFFNFTTLYWFCHISKWICHRYTCVPHPEPSSLLPPHTIPLGRPSAPAPSIQYRASNLDWRLVSYILYVFQCHSPKSSHPLPLPQSP